MKTLAKLSFQRTSKRVLNFVLLLTSSVILFSYNALAQDGPSMGNLNKNIDAAKEEISHSEKMQYLYMGLGFALVIAIAWFSTSLAKKRRIAADAERAKRNQHLKHSSHDPYFNHRAHHGHHGHGHQDQKVKK